MRRAMAAISTFASMQILHILNSRTTFNFFPSSASQSSPSFSSSTTSKTSASISSSSAPSSLSSNSFITPQKLSSPSNYSDYINLEPYLGCSMQGKRLKIAVLLSGGVDSSVALRFLQAAGHSCTAFYLKIWFQEDFANFWCECPWDEDLRYAKSVCDQVNVPLEIVHLSDEYWRTVISYIIGEYRVGRTPNPDIICNTRIKFGAFLESVENKGYDYIASGHYASVKHSSCGADNAFSSVLELSKDMLKDQTYFLSHLSQFQLRRLLFPLGCISKDEVRYLATQMGLPNNKRKDSQGLCFLGKVKFSEFISRHIGELEGILLEAETGDYLGNHRGFWFYTIGQRHGLRLPGGPWFVVEKDVQNNVVFVSRNYFSLEKRRRTFRAGSLNWFSGTPPENRDRLLCKVRHGPDFYHCSIELEDKNEFAVVHLFEDDQGLAAGQFTAFYHNNICLGSGVILDSWDDSCFPVCPKAIEIARMKDKSKLGKPIRIFNLENDSNESLKPNGQFLDLQHVVS